MVHFSSEGQWCIAAAPSQSHSVAVPTALNIFSMLFLLRGFLHT